MTSAAGPRQRLLPTGAGFGFEALWASLRPTPGRWQASLRMLLACIVIITLSMSLQVPSAALSAYMVFFISREDMASTATTGIVLIVAVTLAIGLSFFAFMLTIDHPALRLLLMTALFGGGMYISRVFVAGPLGFGLGFILLVTLTTVDLYPGGEPLVRDTLWLWAALCFSIAVVILVNVLVMPARPIRLLRQEIAFRLDFAAGLLARHAAGQGPSPSQPTDLFRALDTARPATLLKLAAKREPALARCMSSYTGALAALGELLEAACMLDAMAAGAAPPTATATPPAPPASPASPASHATLPALAARLEGLRATCLAMARTVEDPGLPYAPLPQPAPAPGQTAATGDPAVLLVAEMERDIVRLRQHWQDARNGIGQPLPPPAKRLFAPDTISNPAHMQFALKVSFAAMLCYVLYTALNWPGIHTNVITCAVIALSTSGATIHKATMRIMGALTGGALALLATVFIVPQLESLGGLLLVIAPVALLCAWISCGAERTAYFSWQMAFAFFLGILHGFGPSTDVTVVRDRVVGVLIGIVVMGLVFHYVWPERAIDRLRAALARALRASAGLLARPAGAAPSDAALNVSSDAASGSVSAAASAVALDAALGAGRSAVLQALRAASAQVDAAGFEAFQPEHGRIGSAFTAVQAAALSGLHLAQLQAAAPQAEAAVFEAALADVLRQAAARLEGAADADPAAALQRLSASAAQLDAATPLGAQARAALLRAQWLAQELRA